jgi:hypothetical protein
VLLASVLGSAAATQAQKADVQPLGIVVDESGGAIAGTR